MLSTKKLAYKIVERLNVPITTRVVGATIGKVPGSSVSVTAPAVSGYTFVCWFAHPTSGWIGSVYSANPTNATTTLWNVATSGGGSGTGDVNSYALYRKGN